MIFGIQIVGVLFALVMMYMTFLYYKKNSYSGRSFVLWILIWAAFLIVTFFPQTLYGIMEELSIQRTVDLFVIGGFMFLTVVIFYLYTTIKRLERKIEMLVRRMAVQFPKAIPSGMPKAQAAQARKSVVKRKSASAKRKPAKRTRKPVKKRRKK